MFVMIVAACAGSQEPRAPSGPTCESTVAKMEEIRLANLAERGAGEDILVQARAESVRVKPLLAKACVDDRWSPELLRCIDVTPPAEVEARCVPLVTPAQEAGVRRARKAAEDAQ